MAKVKLDWFKLDCQNDDKLDLIEAEFGLIGFAVVVKLWQKIYGSEGYYCEWNEDVALVFAKKNGVGANAVSEIIQAAIRRGIFDEKMFSEFGILTSQGIQNRYFDITSRRKGENSEFKYLLACHTQNSENADISSKNVDISEKNVYISSQRREEKKREDKSRAEKKRADAVSTSTSALTFVKLSSEQYTQLTTRYPKHIVDDYIQRVDDYAQSKNRGYPDYAVVIARWIDQDVKSGKTSLSEPSYDSDEWGKMVDSFDPSMLL